MKKKLAKLKPWDKNPRTITKEGFERLKAQIKELGEYKPLIITPDGTVLGGNMRLRAYKELGYEKCWVNIVKAETEEQKLKYALSDNDQVGEYQKDDLANLIGNHPDIELDNYSVNLGKSILLTDLIEPEIEEDEVPEVEGEAVSKLGEVYQLGRHRLMCGDATKKEDVEKLMDGKRADMVFTDPPYGIGKEIMNDNLKYEAWVEFYKKFTDTMLSFVVTNAYFYVWGYFETLSDYWQQVIKPRGDCNFRNFIIWKKSYIQGLRVKDFRQFPEHYGACLLCIFGQPFQNGPWSTSPNAEFYWEGFEPIRKYLDDERKKMGWDIVTMKKIVGHSDLLRDHWVSKSQWSFPTREVYQKFQEASKNDAFRKDYDELRKDYDELRGYHNNEYGWTDIWEFDSLTIREGEIVLDLFGGSGSTLIACEQTNRICYMMEIDPKYCDVIRKRYENYKKNN